MTNCSICKLPPEKVAEIDAALRAGLSLTQVSEKTGGSRSSIFRHKAHVTGLPVAPAPIARPPIAISAPPAPAPTPEIIQAPQQPPAPAKTAAKRHQAQVAAVQVTSAAPEEAEVARKRVLERNESLFAEAMDGLRVAKEPIRVQRPDGSMMDIPGSASAAAAFLRVAGDRVNFDAQLHGLLDPQARHVSVNVLAVIMSPKDEPDTIEIHQLPADEPADQTTTAPGDAAPSSGVWSDRN